MTMTDPDSQLDPETPETANVRQMREQMEAQAAELKALKLDAAFRQAGVDTTTPLGQLAMKGYEGEMDPAKIKDWAVTTGILATAPPPTEPTTTAIAPGETGQTAERNALVTNAPADSPQTLDPRMESLRVAEDVVKQGGTAEDGMAAFLAKRAEAAHAGDQRVLIEEGKYY